MVVSTLGSGRGDIDRSPTRCIAALVNVSDGTGKVFVTIWGAIDSKIMATGMKTRANATGCTERILCARAFFAQVSALASVAIRNV